MTSLEQLLSPYTLAGASLRNRFVMAPMTRNRATADGVPTALMVEYYAQRAEAGLIIAEAATPALAGQTYPNIAAMYNDAQRDGWADVVAAVAEHGGSMVLQLQHGGRVGHPATNGVTPMAPSPIALPEEIHTADGKQQAVRPREMTREDIAATIRAFVDAARRAVEAGFIGVEVHAANGYLLHQFLSPNTNARSDEYGGSVPNRQRFVLETVDAVAAEIGEHRVGVRISPGNTVNGISETRADIDQMYPSLARELNARKLAYLHVAFADDQSELWATLRQVWGGTLIGNPALDIAMISGDGGLAAAQRMAANGGDLIALGRPFLANPDLVSRFRRQGRMNPLGTGQLMYVGGREGYTDYPTLED